MERELEQDWLAAKYDFGAILGLYCKDHLLYNAGVLTGDQCGQIYFLDV